MYKADRAPKIFNDINSERVSFRIPQHISKLVGKLLKLESNSNIDNILKMFAYAIKGDEALREIYIFFGWSEDKRIFTCPVKNEDFLKRLEKEFEFNARDLQDEEAIGEIKSLQVHSSLLNNNNLPNQQGISNSINSNHSLFNSNKNESNDMLFYVQKPIPLSNSQGERNIMMQETHLDLFLTNSAKVGWNNNSGAVNEDESSLISHWQKSSNSNKKNLNKTPSFYHEEASIITDENGSQLKNNSQTSSNFNGINPFIKSSFICYKDYLSQIKPNSGGEKRIDEKNLNINGGYYGQSFRPFVNQNVILSNPMPYNLFTGNYPFNNTSNQINISSFKIKNSPLNKSFSVDSFNCNNLSPPSNENRTTGVKKRVGKQIKIKILNKKKIKDKERDKDIFLNKKTKKQLNPKDKISQNNLLQTSKLSKLTSKKKLKLKENKKYSNIPIRSSNFGLKEISKKVKEIVKKLKRASYKQISDVIVNEINQKDTKDEKNIRRRIYDSLNVMKAMNLFRKDKSNKFILWNGDINNNQNFDNYSDDYDEESSFENINKITDRKKHSDYKNKKTNKNSIKKEINSNEEENLIEMKSLIVKLFYLYFFN